MNKLLIIDDENQLRALLARIIGLEGYEVFQADCCKAGIRQVETVHPDVVLCDVFLPDGNGVDMITEIKKKNPSCEVIMLTAHGNIADGVQAIKNGAFDYITKGDDNNKILPLISRALETVSMAKRLSELESQINRKFSFDSILGDSKAIKEAVSLAKKVSQTDVPVLLTGETGAGKEVFAQSIHQNSQRSGKSFVAINCSAFSKELLESEMFGYKAGAFTGALKDKKGLFEEANNGTIFLDEIGEMAIDLQAKMLRIIETGEFLKIGETKPTRIDVRIIAATNRDLVKEIESGNFREDLFYRLSVFQIKLPPLRERVGDIEIYARFFAETISVKMGKRPVTISNAYMDCLKKHPWKGNIRELRNVMERSIIVASGDELMVEDLPIEMQSENVSVVATGLTNMELAGVEKLHIQRVLQYTSGNKTEAARLLKIGLTTLYRKIEEYNL